MASKLAAARIASWSGIRSVIARAAHPDVLVDAVARRRRSAPPSRLTIARCRHGKLWIAFAAEVEGTIEVDAGAERALTDQPRSLLPAGVVAVHGAFDAGATVEVVGPSGRAFARGMTAADADGRQRHGGSAHPDLPADVVHEVIHRDDLVVLP